MESCWWCSDCGELFEKKKNDNDEHKEHIVSQVNGIDVNVTVDALDDMITFGLKTLKNREQQIQNARDVKTDINMLRNQFIENSKARIERIVKDVRVAMEYRANELLKEVDQTVGDMELKSQSIIKTSRAKLDSIRGFIQEAAMTLPDEETGLLDAHQLRKLFAYYKTMERREKDPSEPRLKFVDLRLKYPDSYMRKAECKKLADNVSGCVENPTPKRKSFLHDPLPDENGNILPLQEISRITSRDKLVN